MNLNYKKLGHGPPLLILHGLFGMLDNWMTLGKKYAEHFEVYLIDQRNHGKSPHSDEFSFSTMADDLLTFIEEHYIRGAFIIGHSMGGKTLIEFAGEHAHFIKKMVIVDIGIKAYKTKHKELINAMEGLNLDTLTSRKEAEELLQNQIPNLAIRLFLLKNLYWKNKTQLAWKFNLKVIKQNLNLMMAEASDRQIKVPTLFLKGGNSDYILNNDEPSILKLFPKSQIISIPDAGHWVHAEKPNEFYQITYDFFMD